MIEIGIFQAINDDFDKNYILFLEKDKDRIILEIFVKINYFKI